MGSSHCTTSQSQNAPSYKADAYHSLPVRFWREKTDPFSVCGPPKYSELRISLAQCFNAVGIVIGPGLGSCVFFKNTGDDLQSLKNVQWVYLAIEIFVFILAFVFYISPIPEVKDADMEH